MLGVEYPVLSAGMGAGARAELVAAVSGAGGFGVLGASGLKPADLEREIARIRALTDRPFGINVIIRDDPSADADEDRRFVIEQIGAGAAQGAGAIVLFWGDPTPYVRPAHDAGIKVLIQVGSVEEAVAAAAAGVDAVIAQGVEAGGHVRGTTSIWDLLPAAVEALAPLPVLASGGIGDGPGLARALELGAQGVSLGTRFVASEESNVHPDYKQRIVASSSEDTVYTADLYDVGWPAAPHRTLRNKNYAEWVAAGRPSSGQRPGEGTIVGTRASYTGEVIRWPRYASGMITADFDGDIEYAPMWAGESCEVVQDTKPAGEIVADLVRDARSALEARGRTPGTSRA